jgi:nucleotide-binding universal stress UspA family protein
MISKLLVAYDGSKQSEKAYNLALDLATRLGVPMVVLAVARPPEPPVAVELQAVIESATEYFEEHFKSMKEDADKLGVEATFHVRAGHPAEQIVRMANEEKADAIVMGHRGESFLQKWMVGSVAKRVMSYAHCTVMVVR